MVESVDTLDLKSSGQQCLCGFKSRSEYDLNNHYFLTRVMIFCFYITFKNILTMDLSFKIGNTIQAESELESAGKLKM